VKWVRVTIQTTTVLIDAMQYYVQTCLNSAPKLNNDIVQAFEDVPVNVVVNANDYDPQNLPLQIAAIVQQPLTGRVSINMDNTITYLNLRDQINGGVDSFTYRSCNSKGLCSTATVVVNITADGCGPNQYKPGNYSLYTATLTTSADAYISNSSPNTNYGNSNQVYVKGKSGDMKRGLLRFSLPAIPGNAIIDSAMLSLYMEAGPSNEATTVYRILKPWTEPGVNWNKYDATNNWTTPGGDGDNVAIANSYLTGAVPGWKNWNVRSVVQGWVSGTYPNYGMGMARNPEGSGTQDIIFRSKEGASFIPRLYVAYRVPLACTAVPTYAPLALPDTAATTTNKSIGIAVIKNDLDNNKK